MTATQRAVVDDLGNINVHGRSALEIVWKVKDAAGSFINISASDLFVEIATKLRIALVAGEDNYSRKLTLTRAQIATLPLNQPLDYALHDETPSSPATIWNGKITAYGFRTAPSGAAAVDPGTASWTGATVTVQQGESVPTVVVTYMGATGYGMPSGGTVGQYIRKSSSTEYDVAWDTITGSDVGLGNVDNTSDANKPVSTAQQAALDLKLNLAGGTMSGVLAMIAGTAALPGLAVAGDLNTGIYGVSADVLGVSAGGVQVQTWGVGTSTLTGALGINVAPGFPLHVSGAGPDVARFDTSGSSAYASWAIANTMFARVGSASTVLGAGAATDLGIRSQGHIYLATNGANVRWQVDSTTGSLFAFADNTVDIGANATSNRPRNVYAGTSFIAPLGAVGTPSHTFAGDSDTGLWSPAANTWALSAGGVETLRGVNGTVSLTGSLAVSSAVNIGGTATTGATSLGSFGNSFSLIGGTSLTDVTTKSMRVGLAHYTNAEEPMALLVATSAAGASTLNIGGGVSLANAATKVAIYTAANNTTTTGTERWSWDSSGHYLPTADNTYDIGASGASRPRNIFVANTVTAAIGYITANNAYFAWTGRSVMRSGADGLVVLTNAAETDFSRLQFGGTTSAFPSIGRNGAGIWLRLADNSSHAGLECAAISAYGEVRSSARLHAYFTTAIPAGGTAGVGVRVSDTSNFGVFFGSGAPTLSAAKGSLYLRSDGSGTGDRMYVNTDGATAWTAVTTAT